MLNNSHSFLNKRLRKNDFLLFLLMIIYSG